LFYSARSLYLAGIQTTNHLAHILATVPTYWIINVYKCTAVFLVIKFYENLSFYIRKSVSLWALVAWSG
jgi:hypothetical protein